MCTWVFRAGAGRISHVALMRASAASRRFARLNLLLLAFAAAFILAAHAGWHVTRRPLDQLGPIVKPLGRGWLAILFGRHPTPEGIAQGVQVWWNPAQAIIAFGVGLCSAILAGWLLFVLCRAVVELGHRRRYRRQGRMSAAMAYSTAWIVPAFPAGLLIGLWPLSLLGEAGRWGWAPSEILLFVVAGGFAGVAAMFWWFWLIRLSAAAPADTRGRVFAAFLLIIPAMVAGVTLGWWFGLNRLLAIVFDRLNMSF